ncbi:MAG: hypothetical protein U0610_31915 [bacterium]
MMAPRSRRSAARGAVAALLVLGVASARAARADASDYFSPPIEARFRGLCADAPSAFSGVPLDGYALRCRHLATNRDWYSARFLDGSHRRIAEAVRREAGAVRTVFYPFGGPDLTTPFTVFPDAERVIAVALESVGAPASFAVDPHEKAVVFPERAEELSEPSSVRLALTALLSFYGVGYFTVEEPFPSVPVSHVVLLEAIHDLGATIERVRPIALDAEGAVVPAPSGGAGLEIVFRDRAGSRRVYEYFTANLADERFPQDGGLAKHVALAKPDGVLIKAGSNLIVEPGFSRVRALVLGNARAIVEDGELAGEGADPSRVKGFRHHEVALDGLGFGYAQHAASNHVDLWLREPSATH